MSQKVKYSVPVDKEKHSIKRCDSSSSFNDTKKEEDRYESFYINHSLNLIWITKSVRQLKYFQTYYSTFQDLVPSNGGENFEKGD